MKAGSLTSWSALLCLCIHGIGVLPLFADAGTSSLWGEPGNVLWDPANSLLPDFTVYGYKGGAEEIPDWPVDINAMEYINDPQYQNHAQAIMAAIEDCKPEHAVLLPKGTYVITEKLFHRKDQVVLRGEDRHETILYIPYGLRQIYGQGILYQFEDAMIQITNDGIGTGVQRCMENLTIKFREEVFGQHFSDLGTNAIEIGGIRDSWFRDITIENSNIGLRVSSPEYTTIENVELSDFQPYEPVFLEDIILANVPLTGNGDRRVFVADLLNHDGKDLLIRYLEPDGAATDYFYATVPGRPFYNETAAELVDFLNEHAGSPWAGAGLSAGQKDTALELLAEIAADQRMLELHLLDGVTVSDSDENEVPTGLDRKGRFNSLILARVTNHGDDDLLVRFINATYDPYQWTDYVYSSNPSSEQHQAQVLDVVNQVDQLTNGTWELQHLTAAQRDAVVEELIAITGHRLERGERIDHQLSPFPFAHFPRRPDQNGYSGHSGIKQNSWYNVIHNLQSTGIAFHHLINVNSGRFSVLSKVRGENVQMDWHGGSPNDNLWTEWEMGDEPSFRGGGSPEKEYIWNVNASIPMSFDEIDSSANNVVVGLKTTQDTETGGNFWHENIDPDILYPKNLYLAQVDHLDKPKLSGGVHADAGPAQRVLDADNDGRETVPLNGGRSEDSFGEIASYVWTLDGEVIASGVSPWVELEIGTHWIHLVVTDNEGNSASDRVQVVVYEPAPTNRAPYAGDIQFEMLKNTQRSITLVANDVDQGPQPLTFHIESGPMHGMVTLNGNSATYVPDPDYLGPDRFTWTTTDGESVSNEGEVLITVVEVFSPTSGLLALYRFDEGSGTIVYDQSGFEFPLDLFFSDSSNLQWGQGSVVIGDPGWLEASTSPQKITDAVQASNEITIETWITPESDPPDYWRAHPIVSISGGTKERNITLAQDGDAFEYVASLRTPSSGDNGTDIGSGDGTVSQPSQEQHVVYTRSADGWARIYVDGELKASTDTGSNPEGDFSNWSDAFTLILGNEVGGRRQWLGSLHYVAIYSRALASSEIQTRHQQRKGIDDQTFADWASNQGWSGENALPEADANLNGISNLLEYAFDLEGPGDLRLPEIRIVNETEFREVLLEWRQNNYAVDIEYMVEYSQDLNIWNKLDMAVNGLEMEMSNADSDGDFSASTHQARFPVSLFDHVFLRVRVR